VKLKVMLPATELFAALEKNGVIDDASQVSRVVIDARRASLVTVYIEKIGGRRLLDAARLLLDVQVTDTDPEGPQG